MTKTVQIQQICHTLNQKLGTELKSEADLCQLIGKGKNQKIGMGEIRVFEWLINDGLKRHESKSLDIALAKLKLVLSA